MDGVELAKAMFDGRLPGAPFNESMGFELIDVERGKAVFSWTPDASLNNHLGGITGGAVGGILDSVVGLALQTTLPEGKAITTLEIKVNFLKAVRISDGALTATGTVVKSGSRVGFTEGTVTDASGGLVATASATLLIVDFPRT